MSKIGKLPILLPPEVEVVVNGCNLKVAGPKGAVTLKIPRGIKLDIRKGRVVVLCKGQSKAIHGTVRANIANMVHGVSQGWAKTLELVGAGYRAELDGNTLVLNLGYSHPIRINPPSGISLSVEKTYITVEGVDRALVGQVAAEIRATRPPEPYKGKGVRYKDEEVKRKAGKAAKTQGVTG